MEVIYLTSRNLCKKVWQHFMKCQTQYWYFWFRHMVFAYFCFYDFYTFLFAQLTDYFTYAFSQFSVYLFSAMFCANTMWYWHLYVECDNVFISLFPFFFIMFLISCILVMRLPNRFYYTLEVIFSPIFSACIKLAVFIFVKIFCFFPGRIGGLSTVAGQ